MLDILIVEDDKELSALLTDFLREEGLKQIENYLTLACEKAHVCSVELDELKDLE